jgi:hypothetical protein
MAEKIKLVRGDTRPALLATLTDETTGAVVNITGAVPRMRFRAVGSTLLVDTLVGTVLDGPNGLCKFDWTPTSLSGTPGDYEGEIEITFADGKIQTVYDVLKFKLREQF